MNRPSPLLAAATILLIPACSADRVVDAISDTEVDSIQTTRESVTIASETEVPGVLHVRLAWGYLAWKEHASRGDRATGLRDAGFDWTGGLTISNGTATLDMSTFLEKGDSAEVGAANEVKWNSHTYPHFDGVIATLTPETADAQVVIDTPSFKKTLSFTELATGGEQRFAVEATGRELSISPLVDEDASCSGFIVGFLKADGTTLGFKGLRLSKLGDRLGKLRFESVDGAITAEVLDTEGVVIDTGTGALNAEAKTFTVQLSNGTVRGSYADPSYSSRGSFQATARCP